jgi:hypothetical protein
MKDEKRRQTGVIARQGIRAWQACIYPFHSSIDTFTEEAFAALRLCLTRPRHCEEKLCFPIQFDGAG